MYAASVNPPRRAKLQATTSLLPTLLPSPPSTSTISTSSSFSVSNISQSSETTTTMMQPKKKRGRKPASGASSRAAREAARKANHSRIEKARRGKINDALQELKRLVPPDFAASVREGEGDEDGDEGEDDDDDDEVGSPVSPTGRGLSKRGSGKKSNAEREFKLDILERTVLFVRALLKRVEENERSAVSKASRHTRTSTSDCSCQCHTDSKGGHTRKRKVDEREYKEQAKKRRTATALTYEEQNDTSNVDEDDEGMNSSTNSEGSNDAAERTKISTSPLSLPSVPKNNVRLPSISELLSSPVDIGSTHASAHQLPSPSLSPHFSPHFRSSEGKKAHFAPSLSPPAPSPQLSVPRRRTTSAERGDWSCEARDVALAVDPRLSCPCPVGMSYLLTPPSADPSAMAHQGLQAPVFRLPSSAFAVRDTLGVGVGVGVGEAKTTSGIGVGIKGGDEDEDEGEDENDTEARAATLALLQMRGAGYSRSGGGVGGGVGGGAKSGDVTRTSLTPGGLLGIRTG